MQKGAIMLNKRERQDFLKEIIEHKQVATQDELLYYLQKEGYFVTQSTISRDMKELGVIKTRGEDGELYYTLPESLALRSQYLAFEQMVAENVLRIQQVEFVVVMRTIIDMANMIAAIIDGGIFEEAVGTVAGADTVAIFCKNKAASETLARRLEEMMVQENISPDLL